MCLFMFYTCVDTYGSAMSSCTCTHFLCVCFSPWLSPKNVQVKQALKCQTRPIAWGAAQSICILNMLQQDNFQKSFLCSIDLPVSPGFFTHIIPVITKDIIAGLQYDLPFSFFIYCWNHIFYHGLIYQGFLGLGLGTWSCHSFTAYVLLKAFLSHSLEFGI